MRCRCSTSPPSSWKLRTKGRPGSSGQTRTTSARPPACPLPARRVARNENEREMETQTLEFLSAPRRVGLIFGRYIAPQLAGPTANLPRPCARPAAMGSQLRRRLAGSSGTRTSSGTARAGRRQLTARFRTSARRAGAVRTRQISSPCLVKSPRGQTLALSQTGPKRPSRSTARSHGNVRLEMKGSKVLNFLMLSAPRPRARALAHSQSFKPPQHTRGRTLSLTPATDSTEDISPAVSTGGISPTPLSATSAHRL